MDERRELIATFAPYDTRSRGEPPRDDAQLLRQALGEFTAAVARRLRGFSRAEVVTILRGAARALDQQQQAS